MTDGEAPSSPPIGHNSRPGTCPNCGGPMKHRSHADHGMYWAIMRRAFESWPEDHKFRPDCEENLHGWLLIEVGHKECVEVETHDMELAKAVAKGIFQVAQRQIHCMRIFGTSTGIRICVPGSLAYDEAGKKKYEAIRAAVYDVIEATLGVKIDDLKRTRVA